MLGDAGYHKSDRTLDSPKPEMGPYIGTKHRPRTGEERELNCELASLRARVEHPFRVIKRQFGFTKARYRSLAKSTARLHSLFAPSDLRMVRRQLLATVGWVRVGSDKALKTAIGLL